MDKNHFSKTKSLKQGSDTLPQTLYPSWTPELSCTSQAGSHNSWELVYLTKSRALLTSSSTLDLRCSCETGSRCALVSTLGLYHLGPRGDWASPLLRLE